MRRTALAAALLASVAVSAPAWSQAAPVARPAPPPPAGEGARDMTRAEYMAAAEARFAAEDANRDGVLSAAERMAARPRPPVPVGGGTAGPGASRPARRGMGAALATLDADRDGRVTRAEYDAGSQARMTRIGARGDAAVGGGRPAADMTPAAMAERSARRFERLDTNRDGVLDAAEMEAARAGRPGAGRPD